MSKDEQVRTWDYFGDNSKNFSDRVNQPVVPSFDFAQGPVTKDQLLEWVDYPDYVCPDVVQFDYQRVTKLISDCLANREKVSHLGLPPVFWRLLEENLAKAENLWGFTVGGYIGWTKQGLSENPNQRQSVFTTATQLHILFSSWYEKYGDSLSGTGDVIWAEVLSEIKFSQGRLDRIRVSSDAEEKPFFLWEADYPSTENLDSTITIQSPEIAAWFVLFSLNKVYRLFCLLVAEVLRGPSEGDDAELSHNMFEYWADIQAAMAVAQYWYDRIYSLLETLGEHEKVLRLISRTINWDDSNPRPNVNFKSMGTCQLFDWFSNSADIKMTERKLWQATWAALKNEQPPSNPETLKNFYLEKYSLAVKRIKSEGEKEIKNFLPVLAREVKNPTKEAVGGAVMRLTNRSPDSWSVTIKRDSEKRHKLIAEREEFSTRAKERLLKKRLLAEQAAKKI